ncbi:MAG TPA: VWA domain-containing protein [Polyangiaceae bacterium]|nr:VWA domain-containing protein [Polyangiaceae bacterium]
MHFVGLSTGALVATVAGVFLATALLYVLKLRRRPVAVPFSPIWQRVLRDKDASELFSRLRSLLSLLLQLVIAGLVIAALADPRPAAGAGEGRSVVVLVDTSASMQATDVLPSRIDVAKKKAAELVSGLGSADRMLVAKMDASVAPLTTMTGEPADLRDGILRLEATETHADVRRALAFALDALRGAPHPEIVVVSDGAGFTKEDTEGLDLGAVKVSFAPIGASGRNVAVTGFSVRRYPLDASRYEVLLEVTNTNDAPADVELSLLGDGEVVDVTRLSLKPNERLPRVYGDLGGASRKLEARIKLTSAKDELPADDRAYALMPERRRARVQVVTKGNTYLEAALLLDEYLDVTTVGPAEYRADGPFDVTIFDGVGGALPEHGGALYLDMPAEGGPLKLGKPLTDFGFDSWDRKSPILRFMAVENVQVARGHALVPEASDHVVGASESGPILVSGRRDARPFVALGFDPRNSDLVLRVAWPLFVLNVIHTFAEEDASYLSAYRTGEPWKLPVPGEGTVAWVKDPGGVVHEVPVQDGRASLFGERAGFYELSLAEGAPGTLFAANLSDPAESRIEPGKSFSVGKTAAGKVEGFSVGVRREIWVYLVAAAVLLSVLEWFSYHRRITV